MSATTGPQILNGQTGDGQSAAPVDGAHGPDAAVPVTKKSSLLRIVLALVLFGIAGGIWYTFGRGQDFAVEPFNNRIYICSATLKTFEHQIQPGEVEPILSPFSGKNTGYLAETCYWTKSGKRKKIPTYVLLNEHIGRTGKTICPDCGREVVGHNPPPPENTPME